jgi:hypothetical protein
MDSLLGFRCLCIDDTEIINAEAHRQECQYTSPPAENELSIKRETL